MRAAQRHLEAPPPRAGHPPAPADDGARASVGGAGPGPAGDRREAVRRHSAPLPGEGRPAGGPPARGRLSLLAVSERPLGEFAGGGPA